MKIKYCTKCSQVTMGNCLCERIDHFFWMVDNLRPFDKMKPKAPVYDLAEYRKCGILKRIA